MKALPKKQCINCEYLKTCWYPKNEKGNETVIHNCQDYDSSNVTIERKLVSNEND